MKKSVRATGLATIGCAAVALSGCHLLFPFQSTRVAQRNAYMCEAQIYRVVGDPSELFSEEWQAWVFPEDLDSSGSISLNDAQLACEAALDDYVDTAMAPGFAWQTGPLDVVASNKPNAADCVGMLPQTYGAPIGAELSWDNPPESQGGLRAQVQDKDGNIHFAETTIKNANVRYAERTGLPDFGGSYDKSKRHIRVADVHMEFDPFSIGDFRVNRLYIQSIGTIYADNISGADFRIPIGRGKIFFHGTGSVDGDSGDTNFCFVNSTFANFRQVQGGLPQFVFAFQSIDLPGQPAIRDVRINLTSPVGTLFDAHQPVGFLEDIATKEPMVDLVPSIARDEDRDLTGIIWFEDFEDPAKERFLGIGNRLDNVPFAVGTHDITAVIYDQRGAYNVASATVKILPREDTTGEGEIDCDDLAKIRQLFGKRRGDAEYDAAADINNDGVINVRDLQAAARKLPQGTMCS